jgi:hypothetical protein
MDNRTNKQTNICSIFRDKLSLPQGSLDFRKNLPITIIIAEHFPGKVMDFTTFNLLPFLAFTFDLLPKSDEVALCWFHIPPRVQITCYVSPPPSDHFLCTSFRYRIALAPFHQKRWSQPYLCFYHTSPIVFRTFVYPHP